MEELAPREVYGKSLIALGRQNPDIVVLDADLSPSTMTHYFASEFPQRFFDCGLAEQNMISIAAGLAASGKIPFVSTFAVFAACRCFDQVRICLSQTKLNVKIVASHGGISVGEDGISHQAIEDLALYCALPGFTVIVPADAMETAEAIKAVADTHGPVYVRLGRPKVPAVYFESCSFAIGKSVTLREGKDVTIIATGIMVARALEASNYLAEQGVECRVINMSTINPLDEQAIISASLETGALVVAEEHIAHGGLGSRVAMASSKVKPVPMEYVNLGERYGASGKSSELLQRYGLTDKEIAKAAKKAIERKKQLS